MFEQHWIDLQVCSQGVFVISNEHIGLGALWHLTPASTWEAVAV